MLVQIISNLQVSIFYYYLLHQYSLTGVVVPKLLENHTQANYLNLSITINVWPTH